MQGDIPTFSFDCEEPALAGVCAPFSEMILAQGTGLRAGPTPAVSTAAAQFFGFKTVGRGSWQSLPAPLRG
jgi:hypothetical protein